MSFVELTRMSRTHFGIGRGHGSTDLGHCSAIYIGTAHVYCTYEEYSPTPSPGRTTSLVLLVGILLLVLRVILHYYL